MLKQILCSAVFFLGLTTLFSQSSPKDQWIWSRVNDAVTQQMWQEVGLRPGPNETLVPGQTVPFNFSEIGPIVKSTPADLENNTPWELIGKFYQDSVVAPPVVSEKSNFVSPPVIVMPQPGFWQKLFSNGFFLFFLMFLAVLLTTYFLQRSLRREKKQKEEKENAWRELDPVTSGAPMVVGGLTPNNLGAAFQAQGERMYPGKDFKISDITPGRLFGVGDVSYAGEKTGQKRQMSEQGERAYQATLTIENGEDKKASVYKIFAFQACGNDARQGNYTNGDLIFVPDLVVPAPVATNMNTADSQQSGF